MSGSKYWWFRWSDEEGQRHAVSLKTDDEAGAIIKAREILAEGLLNPPQKTGIERAITDYLHTAHKRTRKPMRAETVNTVRFILQSYAKHSGIEYVGHIAQRSIEDWVATLRDEGKSRDTIHSYVTRLKTFIAYLVRLKLLRPDILDDVHIPERAARGRRNWLRSETVEDIIAQSKNWDLTFILYCGFHAGMRRNEISNAKVHWFDLDHRLIHIQNDPKSGFILKDRDNRVVPISAPFANFLKTFLADKSKESYVLKPNQQSGVWRYRYDFNRLVRTHFATCNVVCSIHDMRRSFASNLVSAGESVYIVANWLGDGVQVIERSYGHLAPAAGNIDRLTTGSKNKRASSVMPPGGSQGVGTSPRPHRAPHNRPQKSDRGLWQPARAIAERFSATISP
jgi:integrase